MPAEERRDRLRELLDAVLAEEHDSLGAMAEGAYASPFHFCRLLRRETGEPPVAMRRRVMLERASWQLASGSSVSDAARAAGYESPDGFARAYARGYGHPPGETPTGDRSRWLPAPNGIHFHPPTSLWVDAEERPASPLAPQLLGHDADDTRLLLELAAGLPEAAYRRVGLPGHAVLDWEGTEESLAELLDALVWTKEVWLAALVGRELPTRGADDPAALLARHEAVTPDWLSAWRDVDRRRGWDDRLVDALCDPPQSFQLASVLAHVVTFSAHRRLLARTLLRTEGVAVDRGDPILWLRARRTPTLEEPA